MEFDFSQIATEISYEFTQTFNAWFELTVSASYDLPGGFGSVGMSATTGFDVGKSTSKSEWDSVST